MLALCTELAAGVCVASLPLASTGAARSTRSLQSTLSGARTASAPSTTSSPEQVREGLSCPSAAEMPGLRGGGTPVGILVGEGEIPDDGAR